MLDKRIAVVGSGIGGLVCALRLAHEGLQVTVLERDSRPGGKLRVEEVSGQKIDSGPTVFTMKWVFEELLASVGARLDQEIKLTSLPIIGRHFWADGSSLDLFADAHASESAVRDFAGADEAVRFRQFCATTKALYEALESQFIRAPIGNLPKFMLGLGPRRLALLAGIGPSRTLWDGLGRHFTDLRLRQLFARYSTYCGSSPWQAPATLALIAQVEMDGVWAVQGGMAALIQCLVRLCKQNGVVFRLNSECKEIQTLRGRITGILLADGEHIETDIVVYNGDVAALRNGLQGSKITKAVPLRQGERSLSAVTWSMYAKAVGVQLERHNIFFNSNYKNEFENIFGAKQLPVEPTVYICAQDRGVAQTTQSAERLLCLVNAPAVGDTDTISERSIEQLQARTFKFLSQCGLDIDAHAGNTLCTTPNHFHQRFPGTGGALYGQATHGWLSIFTRPGATSPIAGLFLAGGSVHPGPGVPMSAMSGRIAAAAVMEHLGLTSLSLRTATSGGMLTP